jgi:8-oxo-dGTP pyrophosphatase MutT (NUDIX family)
MKKKSDLSNSKNRRLGVQAIIFKRGSNGPKFLVLRRIKNWKGWEFAKGGIEKNESFKKAVLREIREETGITPKSILSCLQTNTELKFDYPPQMRKERGGLVGALYKTFLVRVKPKCKASVSRIEMEHDKLAWASNDGVLSLIKRKNLRNCFKKISDKISF